MGSEKKLFVANLFKKFKEKYRKEGYEKGVRETTQKYEKLIDELEQVINDKLFSEQNNKQTNDEVNINKIEEVIFWFNCYIEVLDTNLFKNMLFKDSNSNEIKIVLDWLDYIEHTYEIKLTYPKTYFYLPNLKKAFTELYQNKLLIEEAERIGR